MRNQGHCAVLAKAILPLLHNHRYLGVIHNVVQPTHLHLLLPGGRVRRLQMQIRTPSTGCRQKLGYKNTGLDRCDSSVWLKLFI